MPSLLSAGMLLLRLILACGFLAVLLAPGWWVAGKLGEGRTKPFFRLLCAIGLALVGYVSFVNLLGKLTENSILALLTYLVSSGIAGALIWRRWPDAFNLSSLWSSRREWIGPLLIAAAAGFPQWLLAVSTNYWDEAASSAIHLTGPNQFSEGLFPPRHNAFPNVVTKYHYGFMILSGTVEWLTGLSANASIDIASTCLWLFVFLFIYFWLRELDIGAFPALWGGFAVLLGGGLSWLYLPRIEVYRTGGYEKTPAASQMVHHYEAAKSWLANLLDAAQAPSLHLRNADGSLSNLPWDIAAQFQQHAVALGIALAVVGLFLLVTWLSREGLHLPLLIANVLCFGVLFLGHAVFGGVAAVTAGVCLLIAWVQKRTRWTFLRGLLFGAGMSILALLHGGMLARGSEYGSGGLMTFRKTFGYAVGGISGFLHWNVAGFGLPLFLTLIAWTVPAWRWVRRTRVDRVPRTSAEPRAANEQAHKDPACAAEPRAANEQSSTDPARAAEPGAAPNEQAHKDLARAAEPRTANEQAGTDPARADERPAQMDRASGSEESRARTDRAPGSANPQALIDLTRDSIERRTLFLTLTVFALFSYLVPQLVFYVSEGNEVEQYTEISKFFFCAHMGLALLSVFGVAALLRFVPWLVFVPCILAMGITPLAFCYAASFDANRSWVGFYHSPYGFFGRSVEIQMGEALRKLKKSNHDVYFDASADERRHDYISELLIYGGSVFTMTPSRFERNGVSYRLAEGIVAKRLVENGRMARLLPGAAEEAGCNWFYSRPLEDVARAPMIVRTRFAKLVEEGRFAKRFEVGARALYSIDKPTADLDRDLELYWRPRIVSQAPGNLRGDGKSDLIFYDYADKTILAGQQKIDLPDWLRGEVVQLYVDSFPGDGRIGLLAARMKDTFYHLGAKYTDVVENSSWGWTVRESGGGGWQREYESWFWDGDIPLIADLDGHGFGALVAYQYRTGEWLSPRGRKVVGPVVAERELPVPLAGRFLKGSQGDLGLWSLKSGMLTLRSVSGGEAVSFKWGGRPGDVLVPGDYDGDGYDEIAVWQRTNKTWYWRHAPDGAISQATFGTDTGIPVPFDYDRDGRVDLAYWEPKEGKIYVSFSHGQSVDLKVPVPPHSLPAFVNWY